MLGEFVDELNFLPVKVHVLHRIELGLELVQVRVELLGLVGDAGAAARATGSLRRHGTRLCGLCRFTVIVVGVELIDFVVYGVQGVVNCGESVDWVPGADSLFTIIELVLEARVALVLLDAKLVLELLHFIRDLIHLHLDLDVVAYLRAFDELRIHFCCILRKYIMNGYL